MIDNLTYEILKRILSNVGVSLIEETRGLLSQGLLLQRTLTIQYEDGIKREHDLYAGKLLVDQSELRGLVVNLSLDNDPEYIFVFRFGTLPMHIIKVNYRNQDESYCRIYNEEKENWITPSIEMLSKLLTSFERFVSWGLLWNFCENHQDLYEMAIKQIS